LKSGDDKYEADSAGAAKSPGRVRSIFLNSLYLKTPTKRQSEIAMKSIFFFLFGLVLLSNCATIAPLFHRAPSGGPNYSELENSPFLSPDSTKLFEGMSMSTVRNNFGEPQTIKSGAEGFVIWQYSSKALYFVDDVLINWREWPDLKFESTQY
jgi:hypothetical protein